MSILGIIALTPAVAVLPVESDQAESSNRFAFSLADAAIAFAAVRAGAVGIVNLELADTRAIGLDGHIAGVLQQICSIVKSDRIGIKCDINQLVELPRTLKVLTGHSVHSTEGRSEQTTVILALGEKTTQKQLKKAIDSITNQVRVVVEVVNENEAKLAESSGADAIIAKGQESSARVGDQTTFVLLQQCLRAVKIPVWAEGGIGLHTGAACHVAGAAGIVLGSQLLLTPESNLPITVKQKFATLDGTETSLVGDAASGLYRIFSRSAQAHDGSTQAPDGDIAAPEQDVSSTNAEEQKANSTAKKSSKVQDAFSGDTRRLLMAKLAQSNSAKPLDRLYVIGQDIAFASELTRRFSSVAGIIFAIERAIEEHAQLAAAQNALKEGAPLAVSHKTRFPLVQGAMTRVSDTADFAFKVAEGGALPFLALALMRRAEVDALLAATRETLGEMNWGVGILGFVPHQLRQEQLEAISKYRPPYALIAGGRPDQAKHLEDMGIKTYLHVPSPMLLESFIEMGSRRFIFEGRECGGHVGPRSSFILWEAMVEKLLSAIGPKDDATAYHVLFAGGVHDGMSAAMVAALAAPLTARGVRVGGLMGTAYLFTKEAVETGAIVKKFQEAALKCEQTVLLETGPGHAIRCIDSPYKRTFDSRRVELVLQHKSRDEVREELELMNLGRLRIASKGLVRPHLGNTADGAAQDAIAELAITGDKKEALSTVPEERQWSEGMYMIGQVAAMHDQIMTIKELHEGIAAGSAKQLESVVIRQKALAFESLVEEQPSEPIAIVGMSCLFPMANDVESYWENILNKVDTITEVPVDQWDWRNYYDPNPLARDKVVSKWGGFLGDVKFDATRYGIPPSSLNSIDPMQMLLLDVTRHALDDAGYNERTFERRKTSVIVANAGHGPITALYSLRSMLGWKLAGLSDAAKKEVEDILPEWTEDSFPGYLGNVAAGRVANRFDLGGINFTVDAACGSSLAALYVGISDLRNGNSDIVLLGATDTHNQPGDYLSFSKTHAFSPQGRCRTFDATADGIVISEGMAMVVLKRLSDAERDGDRIYAVIRGIGGSSDGRDLSLTAPRPAGQVLALDRAYKDAGVSPATVTLVEAHGTGTVAGDRAEIEALRQVFEHAGTGKRSCAVGSVKTMIGHTKAAAGLASIIKIAKALHHKVLPPTMGVTTPNPSCNFETSPFYINAETRPWINPTAYGTGGKAVVPRRAGVSAFGFGGTNFHAVVEEYVPASGQAATTASNRWPAELFVLRAKTRNDLIRSADALADAARKWQKSTESDKDALRILSYSTYLKQLERTTDSDHKERSEQLCLSVVAASVDDLIEKLKKAHEDLADATKIEIKDPRGIYFVDVNNAEKALIAKGKTAFLFSGQGSQHVNMIRDLALEFGELRDTFESANAVLRGRLDKQLTNYIYPPPTFTDEDKKRRQQELTDTQVAQPAVGAADVGLCKLLKRFGIKPNMAAGHSYGEYVALWSAGVMSETDLIKISEVRGRILSHTNGDGRGSMAALSCSVQTAQKIVAQVSGITLANINSPNQCVVSGEASKIKEVLSVAEKAGVQAKEIAVSQAFHSPFMAHSQKPLRAAISELHLSSPAFDVYCNTDAKKYEADTTKIVDRLVEHIVRPVDFVAQVQQMQRDGARIFIEVGPGSILSGLADTILQASTTPSVVLSTDRSGRNSLVQLLHLLAQLASLGQAIDIQCLFEGRVSTQDFLNFKALPAVETNSKKLLYMVNSSSIKPIGAADKAKVAPAKQIAVSTAQHGTHQFNNTGAHVSAQLKPTSGNGKQNASTGEAAAPNPLDVKTPLPPANAHAVTSPTPRPAQPFAPQQFAPQQFAPNMPQPVQSLAPLPLQPNFIAQNPAAFPGQRNVDQVMMQFQQTMLQMTNSFLETQQRVMLSYLNARSGQVSLEPFNGNGNTNGHGSAQAFAGNQFNMQPGYGVPTNNQPFYPANAFVPASYPYNPALQTQDPPNGQQFGQQFVQSHETQFVATDSNGGGGHERESFAPAAATAGNAAGETSDEAAMDSEQLIAALLDIVSGRTGYPPDMLDPDLDLEADLGIDSIKRVEILNSFRKVLPEKKQQELEGGIEELAGTKTLRGIMDWIRSDIGGGGKAQPEAPVKVAEEHPKNGNGNGKVDSPAAFLHSLESAQSAKTGGVLGKSDSGIVRGLVGLVDLAPSLVPVNDLAAGPWIVIDDETGVAEILIKQFANRQLVTVRHRAGGGASKGFDADLTDETQVNALFDRIRAKHGNVAGLIHLLSLNESQAKTLTPVYALFHVLKSLEKDLNRKDEKTLLVVAHKLGGTFGVGGLGEAPANAKQAGLVGVVKSVRKEWLNLHAKDLDFAGADDARTVAERIAVEALSSDSRIEIATAGGERKSLQVIYSPINTGSQANDLQLDAGSVILITGGARGITAEIAEELANNFNSKLVLIGKSQRPTSEESAATAGLTSQKELKAAIIEQLKAEQKAVSVSVVENIFQRLIRDREIVENLNKLEQAASSVEYHAVDVRDDEAFSKIIRSIYERHGRIDGVIHGAGIIEDAYVKDKKSESFRRVVETKVLSAETLSRTIDLASLKFMFFFSSVVGRTGNAGQTDYVAANEIYNKMALELNALAPGRVASIMWGPWRGGMAMPELEVIFAKYGWSMIDAVPGREAFMHELLHGSKENAEVIIVGEVAPAPQVRGARIFPAAAQVISPAITEFTLNLDTTRDVYLSDHTFDGVPVMPMAMSVELLMEAAQSAFPGWRAEGVYNLDIPSGIVFEVPSKTITVRTQVIDRSETDINVIATLGLGSPMKRANFRGKVRLVRESAGQACADNLPSWVRWTLDPATELQTIEDPIAKPPTVAEVYGEWLFHGPLFQGIKEVCAIGSVGVFGKIASSDPARCISDANGEPWAVDPILIDSAMQLAGTWARHHLDIMALPTGFRALHKVSDKYSEQLYVRIKINAKSAMDLSCDLAAYNQDGTLAFVMEGLTGVGSKSLNRLAATNPTAAGAVR